MPCHAMASGVTILLNQLYTLINNILSSLNDKILVGGLLCDLKKVFDWVNYDILLLKIKFYGIVGVAHKLMESYIRNRY